MTVESPEEVAVELPLTVDVADVAWELGLSAQTLHRAINEGSFPAVRVRGCVRVPRGVSALMVKTALEKWRLVDSAEFCAPSAPLSPSQPLNGGEQP